MYSEDRGNTLCLVLGPQDDQSVEICGNISITLLIGTWTWAANAPKQAYSSQTLFILVLIPTCWSQAETEGVWMEGDGANHYTGQTSSYPDLVLISSDIFEDEGELKLPRPRFLMSIIAGADFESFNYITTL